MKLNTGAVKQNASPYSDVNRSIGLKSGCPRASMGAQNARIANGNAQNLHFSSSLGTNSFSCRKIDGTHRKPMISMCNRLLPMTTSPNFSVNAVLCKCHKDKIDREIRVEKLGNLHAEFP